MRATSRSYPQNQPAYNVRAHLVRLLGIDLVDVIGISESLAQTIIAEIGTDMSRFPTSKYFCSWLGLAPHNDISGGKVLRSRVMKVHNRAGQALRQAAQSCSRSHSRVTRPSHPNRSVSVIRGARRDTSHTYRRERGRSASFFTRQRPDRGRVSQQAVVRPRLGTWPNERSVDDLWRRSLSSRN